MQTNPENFNFSWRVDIGTVVAFLALLLAFWRAHTQNVRSIQEIKTKVDLMYDWFCAKIQGD